LNLIDLLYLFSILKFNT